MEITNKLKKNGYLFVVFAIVFFTSLINFSVRLYGDDFFYLRFSQIDIDYFISRHVDHYMRANGRVIVHLLLTFFLGLDIRIWQIVNSLMLGLLALFGMKTISTFKSEVELRNSIYIVTIFFVGVSFFEIDMTRQSVYWLTGSFNYVYPIMMLLIYWFLLNKGNYGVLLPIMAFLSAATVEQVSLMSFGLSLLVVLEKKFIAKKKLNSYLIYSLVASSIGMATVIFAPSVFLRASIEDAPIDGFIPLLLYNIKFQGTTFIFSKVMMPYLIMAITSSLGVLYFYKDRLKKFRVFNLAISLYGLSASLCWLWQMTSRNTFNVTLPYKLFYLFIGVGITTLLFYAAILIYIYKPITNHTIPLISMILCFGSQMMLLISPVYGFRNLFAAVIMLVIYTASILPSFHQLGIPVIISLFVSFMFNKPWLIPFQTVAIYLAFYKKNFTIANLRMKIANYIGYGTIILVSLLIMQKSIYGYYTNAKVYDENVKIAAEYNKNQSNIMLDQKKLPNDLYAWAMPYHNEYYTPYYNLYLGINQKAEINWQK